MRNVLLRRRPDGLMEVTRVRLLRRAGILLGVTLLGATMVLAVVAVWPAVALAIPSLVLVSAYLGMLQLRNHHAVKRVGVVVPLPRRRTVCPE